jgi:hypothetical protein
MVEVKIGVMCLKMEGEDTSQGIQEATRSWKRQGKKIISQNLQKEQALLITYCKPGGTDFGLLSSRPIGKTNFHCFVPLSLW